jgi:hypothetical protein
MTSQTKHYIDLSEIVGIRLQCKSCKCSLLIEIESKDGAVNNLVAAHNTLLGTR